MKQVFFKNTGLIVLVCIFFIVMGSFGYISAKYLQNKEAEIKDIKTSMNDQTSDYKSTLKKIVEHVADQQRYLNVEIGGNETLFTKYGIDIIEKSILNSTTSLENLANKVLQFFDKSTEMKKNLPTLVPLKNVNELRITSKFGARIDPFTRSLSNHNGVDLASIRHDYVLASGSGKIIEVIYDDIIYGNRITILHENNIASQYAHLSEVFVMKGQIVTQGEIIGRTGTTGRARGDHLHFAIIMNGQYIDPFKFLKDIYAYSNSYVYDNKVLERKYNIKSR